MSTFFIKKKIEARSVVEALNNEKKAEITDVWKDKDAPSDLPSAIGFEFFKEEVKEEE